MKLTDIIKRELIWPDLKAATKKGVLREIAAKVCPVVKGPDEALIAKILEERENLGSTGIQDGIAIPHGKIPGLDRIVIGCGRSIGGIDFDSHDGKTTHLFFVLLAPEFAAGDHLKALARLSKILKDSRFRESLLSAMDADEMYRRIEDEDKKL